jgi:hypothetical protein
MELRQAGAQQGAEQPGASSAPSLQMTASQPGGQRALGQMGSDPAGRSKAPVQAAFGSGGGAAIVFRDYASI